MGPPGVELNGDGIIQGEEVTLFIADGGSIRISGNSPGFDLSAPTSGPYEGICIFFERTNTADCSISGSGLFDVRGAMYMAAAHLEMDGNVDRQVGRIVVNTLQFRGTGAVHHHGPGHPGPAAVPHPRGLAGSADGRLDPEGLHPRTDGKPNSPSKRIGRRSGHLYQVGFEAPPEDRKRTSFWFRGVRIRWPSGDRLNAIQPSIPTHQ